MRMRVSVSPERLASLLLAGRRFVTVAELAEMLGSSRKAAGRILARLEELGLVERWSKTAYRVRLAARGDGRVLLIRLQAGLARRLEEAARREGVAPEELIRRALREYLEKHGV